MTIMMKSLSGAIIISCFFERILRNVKSLEGSRSRTTLRALSANCPISPAYCTVDVLSNVLFTATPKSICCQWECRRISMKNIVHWHDVTMGTLSDVHCQKCKQISRLVDNFSKITLDRVNMNAHISSNDISCYLQHSYPHCSRQSFPLLPCAVGFSSMFLRLLATVEICEIKRFKSWT